MAPFRVEFQPVREAVPGEGRPPAGAAVEPARTAHDDVDDAAVDGTGGADDAPLVAVAPAWVPPALAERWFLLRAGLTPGRVVGGGAALVVLVAAGWWLLRPSPPPVALGLPRIGASSVPSPPGAAAPVGGVAPGLTGATGATGTEPVTTVASPVVVQVAGAVAAPGVYRLPAGARVADLLDAAGGPSPDAAPHALALAQPLTDGQRVVVPLASEVVPTTFVPPVPAGVVPPAAQGGGPGSGAGAAAAGPLDLNTATAEQLDTLPGIGPATAAAIVGHRDRTGPFTSVDGLLEVRGIGPAKLEAIRPLVIVRR